MVVHLYLILGSVLTSQQEPLLIWPQLLPRRMLQLT